MMSDQTLEALHFPEGCISLGPLQRDVVNDSGKGPAVVAIDISWYRWQFLYALMIKRRQSLKHDVDGSIYASSWEATKYNV